MVTIKMFLCYIQISNHLENLKGNWRGVGEIKCLQTQATAEQCFLAQFVRECKTIS